MEITATIIAIFSPNTLGIDNNIISPICIVTDSISTIPMNCYGIRNLYKDYKSIPCNGQSGILKCDDGIVMFETRDGLYKLEPINIFITQIHDRLRELEIHNKTLEFENKEIKLDNQLLKSQLEHIQSFENIFFQN